MGRLFAVRFPEAGSSRSRSAQESPGTNSWSCLRKTFLGKTASRSSQTISLAWQSNTLTIPRSPFYCWHIQIATRCRRSEEHTSELQSQSNLVCRLLLEKKKNTASADELI